MHHKVTVIIPVYNRALLVRAAIESVLRQSFRDFEILVINDGSTDALEEKLKEFKDRRVKCFSYAKNRGAAHARNVGIKKAKSEYIAFLDSDDEWEKDKLLRQLDFMQRANNSTAATCTGYTLHRMKTNHKNDIIPTAPDGWLKKMLETCRISPGSTLMVRKEAILKIGFFDEHLKYMEDWDWLLKFLKIYDLGVVPEVLSTINAENRKINIKEFFHSINTLKLNHKEYIIKHYGIKAYNFFVSTMELEIARIHFFQKEYGAFLRKIMCSAWVSPKRILLLMLRIATKVLKRDY